MGHAILLVLMLSQDVPPSPPALDPPAWALADPYGWERAECSPLVRKDATLEACQVRVRTQLSAALGDALLADLRPGVIQDCRQVPSDTGGYQVQCGAPPRASRAGPDLDEQICDTRPRAQAQGGVAWVEDCRPASGRSQDGGLSLRLFGDDD